MITWPHHISVYHTDEWGGFRWWWRVSTLGEWVSAGWFCKSSTVVIHMRCGICSDIWLVEGLAGWANCPLALGGWLSGGGISSCYLSFAKDANFCSYQVSLKQFIYVIDHCIVMFHCLLFSFACNDFQVLVPHVLYVCLYVWGKRGRMDGLKRRFLAWKIKRT